MNAPQIYNLPVSSLGSHETIVVTINGVIQSVQTWNSVKNSNRQITFFTNNPQVQIVFQEDDVVPVIR